MKMFRYAYLNPAYTVKTLIIEHIRENIFSSIYGDNGSNLIFHPLVEQCVGNFVFSIYTTCLIPTGYTFAAVLLDCLSNFIFVII